MTTINRLAAIVAVGMLLCGAAHAQSWQSYQSGGQTFSTFNGPGGQSQYCTSYQSGGQVFTNCN